MVSGTVDAKLRKRWLPGAVMREHTPQPGRSARFDWENGVTRVNVGFIAKGKARAKRHCTSACRTPRPRG